MDGRIRIFRTTSQVWQMQMWINEEGKYVRESLHTEELPQAKRLAEQRYIFYRAKVQNSEKIFSITATELREKFLDHVQKQVESRQLSVGRQSNIRTHTKHYLSFVGAASKIQNIDRKKFRDYLTFRRGLKPALLATVVINESITIKQMYRFASSEGILDSLYVPDFGTIKKLPDEATRESFTPQEYNQLIGVSRVWWKKSDAVTDEAKYYRRLINDFILIMANGGFRTQEVRLLKWKDIKSISAPEANGESFAEVVIRAENTKTRKSRTIEIRRGDVFQRIRKYSKYTEREDHVFSRLDINDALDKTRLYDWWAALILLVKAKHKDFSEDKTLYCLRHLFITMRIMASMNVYDIAKITGTSLTQIQKHYDAATSLMTSQKMNRNSMRFDTHGNVVLEVADD